MRASALINDSASSLELRVRLVLMAYAAGDAFGVGYEFLDEPVPVDVSTLASRPGDDDWPHGGVSDDTHLSLLTIEAVLPGRADASATTFLDNLRRAIPSLRGLGPTTRAALGLPVEAKDTPLIGTTNGAMMRTALLGIAYPAERRRERRQMVAVLARATHSGASAVATALLCSALVSRAVELDTTAIADILWEEATELAELPGDVLEMLRRETFTPAPEGVSLDPVDTLEAVVWVAEQSASIGDAYRLACELGGDTDTVAALAGSVVIARSSDPEQLLALPWIDEVLWSEIPQLTDAALHLTTMRESA